MSRSQEKKRIRCAIYTRKSTDEGLEQEFNTLDAQRESGEAYIASMKHEGWECLPNRYDDGGFTGGNMERPALRKLIHDIEAGQVDCVIVYKVDRLSRSLLDFSKIMATFDQHGVSFVSVTQQFNTTSSMGRLTLNILLSFAQFERELISERTRDKMGAARRRGKWCGGSPMLGYDIVAGKLLINEAEAEQVRAIFDLYLEHKSIRLALNEIEERGWTTKRWFTKSGKPKGGTSFTKSSLNYLLKNVTYIGQVKYDDQVYSGEHEGIVEVAKFHKAQKLLGKNAQTGTSRGYSGQAMLASLIRCHACGTSMVHSTTTRRKRTYRYYVCSHAQKRGYDQCPAPTVSAPEIERFVVEEIRQIGRDPEMLAHTVEAVRRQGQLQRQERERDLKRLRSDQEYLNGQLQQVALGNAEHLVELHNENEQLQAKIQDKEGSQARAAAIDPEQIEATLQEFDELWDAMRSAERQRLIRMLVKQIEFDGAAGEIAITLTDTGHQLTEVEHDAACA